MWNSVKLWFVLRLCSRDRSQCTFQPSSIVQRKFLASLSNDTCCSFAEHGVTVEFSGNEEQICVTTIDGTNLEDKFLLLESSLAVPNLFNISGLANDTIHLVKRVIADICEFPPHLVDSITLSEIVFSGGCMAGWELEPQTGCEQIFWPNPYKFHDEHIACYQKANTGGLTKMYISYALYAVADGAHEVMHSFQSFARQKDTSKDSWAAEHDASVAALNLVHRALQSSAASLDSYPSSLVELIALNIELDVNHIHRMLTPEQVEGYKGWKESFGALLPSQQAELNDSEDPFVNYCKERVALDAYTESRNLEHQLRSIFGAERRDCDIRLTPVVVTELNATGNYCTIYEENKIK